MVTVVTFNHCFLFIVLLYSPLSLSTTSVPTKSPNFTETTAKVSVAHQEEPFDARQETQLQQSLLPNDKDPGSSLVQKDQRVSKIESQIEKQPQLTAEASQHEPASVSSYHDQSGDSDSYKNHFDHKLSDQGSHHDSGKSDSYGKEWDKLKEKERRVKDRGSGFIKAFTWDREEVSKDKYKDKGSEHSNHADHSKGAEYKHKKESNQHNSGHRHGGKSRSSKSEASGHNSSPQNHPNHQTDALDGEVLAYDPNILLYGGSTLNNLPSTDEVYVQPGYAIDGSLAVPQYYIQPILY